MQKTIVIFIHGLGADDSKWWGSTVSSLTNNPSISNEYDIRFFSYKTDKIKTILNTAKNQIGLGEIQASLENLGNQLSDYIRNNCTTHKQIKLFGHSMGGLVISASLPLLETHANNLYQKISSVAFAGTPLGGSSVASILKIFMGLIVGTQTKSLSLNSKELQSIVAPLPNYLTLQQGKEKIHLQFFYIGEDEVVSKDTERYGPYYELVNTLKPDIITLQGKHSPSVQNLISSQENYMNILRWIKQSEVLISIDDSSIKCEKKPYFEVENNYHQEKKDRSYIVLERYISKTYLQNELIIQDLNETLKVMDTTESIIEFYHGFYKDVEHLANIKYLNKLKKNLIKRNKKLTGTSYKNNTKIKIDRFKYPIFVGQKIINNCISNIEIDIDDIHFKETDNSMGLNFKFNLGQYPIDTIIDFKFSFTLPTDIYHTKQPDTFRFKTAANLTKIAIQEEIYGNSSHKFEVRWKRNNAPCFIHNPIVNLYYRKHYGEFTYEDKEDIYEVVVERK